MNELPSHRFVLRDLPIASRLVMAVFLIMVGVGYFSALVQLHFQHANSGNLLPGAAETIDVYYGVTNMSQLERVLTADESKPFNGGGSMASALTFRSAGWNRATHKLKNQPNFLEALEALRSERDGERLALIDWIQKGAPKEDYDSDSHPLPDSLVNHPITADYLVMDGDKPATPRAVKIQTILEDRCVRCHRPDRGGTPARFPLDTHDNVKVYCDKEISGALSLTRLAQSTHVHLLGFAMLFGLTGIIFSFTSYPTWVRCIFGPFTLVAQVADISCWWLGRANPTLAEGIMVTGSLVGVGLLIHIMGSLFNLFGRTGKVIILALILAGCVLAGWTERKVIEPYLRNERATPEIRDINSKSQAPERIFPVEQENGRRT